ncbi:cytochrome P450 [Nitrospirillum iridis]|uniref:Cytochrome P450 n=1 Tax=Nitrospirillum iridis TaxID=765888 RepID=A0A7X0EFR9_9PROT|nr:cytochrome P450 [Nitrospirillum iridis]MBB6253336.1 hypothetical protein [Nitrospirillum iridis]
MVPIIDGNQDERKSAGLAARHLAVDPGMRRVDSFTAARDILRSPAARQDGAGAAYVDVGDPEHVPVFYLDGEAHRKRRSAIAGLFTPKAVANRYRRIMEQTTEGLLARFRARGEARLDEISFELAVAVAAEIVGLTEKPAHRMAPRIAVLLDSTLGSVSGKPGLVLKAKSAFHALRFYLMDVRPAVRARRMARGDDIISQTLDKGYSGRAILIECMTYATAGMVTTREFIVMAAWHLFDRPDLRAQFVNADEAGQFEILEEILRLEPVAAMIQRRMEADPPSSCGAAVAAGERVAIDIRAVNTDEAAVGACPYRIDPARARQRRQGGASLSFGDGPHTCPGRQVALHETRVFLDRLFRTPGLRLLRVPDMSWNPALMSYELRDARIACDRA